MRPRVAVLTNVPSPYQVELFNAIADDGGIDLRVWYCARRDSRRSWGDPEMAHGHRFGTGSRLATRGDLYYLDPRLAGEIVRWRPDLAVLSVYALPAVQMAMWCATLRGLKWAYWGEAVGAGGDYVIRRLTRAFALMPLRRWAAGFFAVGRKGVANFQRHFGSSRPVLNVPYFSNLERFRPVNATRSEDKRLTFLYVGSFTQRKGVDILARAFNQVLKAVPDARLVVAGDGDPGPLFTANLSEAANGRVTVRGFVPWEALPQLYGSASFLVMPSRYDGWGMVVPEAMASGVPVIGTTAAGAVTELVEDNMTGWQVPPGDSDFLSERMRLAADLSEARLLSMRRRCLVRAHRCDVAVGVRVFARAVRAVLAHGPQGATPEPVQIPRGHPTP